MGFNREDFALFMDLLDGVPWDKGPEGREVQESWLIFNDHLLQAQEQSIPISRLSGKKNRRPTCMNKEILTKLKLKKGVYRR